MRENLTLPECYIFTDRNIVVVAILSLSILIHCFFLDRKQQTEIKTSSVTVAQTDFANLS